jgi:hypothetical protein
MRNVLKIVSMIGFSFSLLALPALAADADWQMVEYHANEQVTIYCGAVLLCDVTLEPGEHINAGLGSLAQLWDNQLIYEGEHPATPHLVLKPYRSGLRENVLVTTNHRIYRLYFVSTDSNRPTYMRFLFTDEEHAREHHAQRMREIAVADRQRRMREQRSRKFVPPKISELDQACVSMPQPGWRMDHTPPEFTPRQVCESIDHTFIALPLGATQPTDLPIPFLLTPDGDRPVNYRFDVRSRVFIIDGTATDYVLIATSGRNHIRLRIQRIEVQAQRKRRRH